MKTKEKRETVEVAVVGSGPAGLGLTCALLERGVDACCISPALTRWVPTYGVWSDELTATGLDIPLRKRWANALVSFPRHEPVVLDRSYARIDSDALFDRWADLVHGHDAFICGSVSSALFSGDFFEIRLDSGAQISARQVFDASGHRTRLTARSPLGPAFQTAFGANVSRVDDTLSPDTMGLMVWDDGLLAGKSNVRTPAFYYVMPETNEIAFSEYTVLAARPKVPVQTLERRLMTDYVSDQIVDDHFERCIIPMGHAVPDLDQKIVGFGGAASMVHPATGYMIARVLATIPTLADAYVTTRQLDVDRRARALWDVVWPNRRVRTHELFQFGLEALLTMNVEETHAFFAAFFSLPDELWRPYQAGTATTGQVAAAMWEVFKRVDGPLKRKLVATGLGPHLAKLGRLVW